jgi:hypothetical protein
MDYNKFQTIEALKNQIRELEHQTQAIRELISQHNRQLVLTVSAADVKQLIEKLEKLGLDEVTFTDSTNCE